MRTALLPFPFPFAALLLASAPALAAEPTTFVAVHRIGATSWVELSRFADGVEPAGGRAVTLGDDFFHATRRAIPGARPMGTAVRLVAGDTTCDGTLGRPAFLGVYYGDEGYGGGPVWLRAAPVRGCTGDFTLGVLRAASAARVARVRDDDEPLTDPIALSSAQARAALTTSPGWLAARTGWAASYPGEPVTSTNGAFLLGDTVWALAEDVVEAECGTRLSSRMFVRGARDGTRTELAFPGSDTDSVLLLGDLDGDGAVEVALGQFSGAVRLVRLAPGEQAVELWHTDGVPFYGCPC